MQISIGQLENGLKCPHCGQSCKLYNRRLLPNMVRWLLDLCYRHAVTGTWVHTTAIKSRGGDYGKLKFWEFMERQPNPKDPKNVRSGYWRPTAKGIQFIKNQISVREFARVFDDTCYRFEGPLVNAQTILQTRGNFNYTQLMAQYTIP